jgi:hypothetical protein
MEFTHHDLISDRIRTLDNAVAFVRSYKGTELPTSQSAVLRLLENVATAEERALAAAAFRIWSLEEGLLSS